MSTVDRWPSGPQRRRPGTREKLRIYASLLREYVVVNLKGEMEFRASFISQIIFMMLNNLFAMFFWLVFFSKFHEIRGWGSRDVLLLWAVGAASFGIANGICGNCMRLHRLITDGQLDYYLTLPKNTLFQLLVSRMSPSSWGDALFGIILGLVVLRGATAYATYAVVLLLSATVLLSFCVILGSIAFWTGSAEGIFSTAINALISFTLYPEALFTGVIRVVLFTALPAGFITYVPVSLLRHFDWGRLGILAAAAVTLMALASWVFGRGLRRYESGNLIVMRM